jgi:hypothetical protein
MAGRLFAIVNTAPFIFFDQRVVNARDCEQEIRFCEGGVGRILGSDGRQVFICGFAGDLTDACTVLVSGV